LRAVFGEEKCFHTAWAQSRLGPDLHLFGEFAAVQSAMSRTVIVETQRVATGKKAHPAKIDLSAVPR
jgi:hypothetical protein